MKFIYLGSDKDGLPIQGEIEASTPDKATSLLTGRGIQVTHLRPIRPAREPIFRAGVTSADIATFCEQLANLAEARHPLPEALRALAKDAAKPSMRRAMDRIAVGLDHGKDLADLIEAEKGVFPRLLPILVRAGAASGNLPETLRLAATDTGRTRHVRRKLLSAMTYPAVVFALMTVVGSFVFLNVVPFFRDMFEDLQVEIQFPTTVVLAFSEHFYIIAGVALVLLLIAIWLFRWSNPPEAWWSARRWLLFHIPLLGPALRAAHVARFCRLTSLLLSSNTPLDHALELQEGLEKGSPTLHGGAAMAAAVRNGISFSVAMGQLPGVYSEMLVWVIYSCERTGRLSEGLNQSAEMFECEAERDAELATSILPAVLVILVGALIAMTVMSLFMPLIRIMQSIS